MNDDKCPECGGAGVEFRGTGLDSQYKVCSAYKTSETPEGHPTLSEVRVKIRAVTIRFYPRSGRFA